MNGILIIDKPTGMTSHDVVGLIRDRFRIKKVGHAGTLDPRASGVLVMLLGRSTRSSNQFINDDKEYDCVMRLGITTDTQDGEGRVISRKEWRGLTHDDIKKVFGEFKGAQKQLPPMFSAVKFKGRKLYELAREGKVIERAPRVIEIYKLEISSIDLPSIRFRVHCSKGTYIRQLCSDIGDRLGCGGYTHYLRRTRSGNFSIKGSISLEELEHMAPHTLSGHLK